MLLCDIELLCTTYCPCHCNGTNAIYINIYIYIIGGAWCLVCMTNAVK